MLIFNIAAIYKDWSVNKKMFETYRSSKTGDPTIDPLNEIPEDQFEKEHDPWPRVPLRSRSCLALPQEMLLVV